VERTRHWYGVDLVSVTEPAPQALNVPQTGGFRQAGRETFSAEEIGLRGGDRIGIVEGQKLVVGGDILLSVQGTTVTSNEDMAKVLKSLETLQPGQDLRVTVLRDKYPNFRRS
jgi:serine protease Do